MAGIDFQSYKFIHHEQLDNVAKSSYISVLEGCEVQPFSGMTVAISSGRIWFKDHLVTVPASNLTLDPSDATLNRTDLIVVDSAGTVSFIKGANTSNDEISAPIVAPSYPIDQYCVLARVNVMAGTTVIGAGDIVDLRVFNTATEGLTLHPYIALEW